MKRKRYTEPQIVFALQQAEAGTPTDNAVIEAFNARFRQECLKEHWFLSVADSQELVEA